MEFDAELYKKQKQETPEEAFYKDANDLNYGQTPEVPKERVDKMVNELEKTISKRKDFSRRRAHVDDEYVTYINDRNKVFNKKIARAYNQYTTEIRQNLERGTAI